MPTDWLGRYLRDCKGGMTLMGLFLFLAGLLTASYAIDVNSLEQQRGLTQVAADSAAHDALVTRELLTETEALAAAMTRANAIMPKGSYGNALHPKDVTFGTWSVDTHKFTATSGARGAVRVLLRRTAANHNPVATYLMKLVGIPAGDVVVRSTYSTYQPICMREGFVAENVVDIQSNNRYLRHFCIHSNSYVKLSSNNMFEAGTVVSMPDLHDLQLSASGFSSNPGLSEALKEGSMNIRVLRRIQTIINTVADPSSRYHPDFLSSSIPETLTGKSIDATSVQSGHLYMWSCNSGSGGTVIHGAVLRGVVIIADRDVTLARSSRPDAASSDTTTC